jgi:subtilisin family serine protease
MDICRSSRSSNSMCAEPETLIDELPVEVMGEGTGPSGWSLESSFDAATGDYFAPSPPESLKRVTLETYLTYPGATEDRFEATWPYLWRLTEAEPQTGSKLIAILDSGVLRAHPLLRGTVREVVDFTGEGEEDRLGHGTMVALLRRSLMLGEQKGSFIILKCVGADGRGNQANLIAALHWMKAFNASNDVKIGQAVMSLGVYNRRLGLFDCDGTCKLCKTALDVSSEISLFVAAGNTAGKTACPARAAFLPEGTNIFAVGRPEEATSGVGTVQMNMGAPPERLRFVKE